VEKAAMEELTRFIESGPTPKELEDAKTAYLEARKIGRAADGSIAGQLTTNLDLDRTFQRIAEEEKEVQELTIQKVREAFQKHIDPKKLKVIRAGDFK
jgi:zinc protease